MPEFYEDDALAPPPIVFRVPWKDRHQRLRALARTACEHPFSPGYYLTECTAEQIPDSSVRVHQGSCPEEDIYDRVAEIVCRFRRIAWSVEPEALKSAGEHPANTPAGTVQEIAHGFPRDVRTMTLAEFEARPDHALLQAAAGDFGTLIYTMGRPEHGNERLGFVGVAVIVPVEEYRRLTLKEKPATASISGSWGSYYVPSVTTTELLNNSWDNAHRANFVRALLHGSAIGGHAAELAERDPSALAPYLPDGCELRKEAGCWFVRRITSEPLQS